MATAGSGRGVSDYTCPACKQGTVEAQFQAFVTLKSAAHLITLDASPPDGDGFQAADCDNRDCTISLLQEPGDGRIRRADLVDTEADRVIEDDSLRGEFITLVERIIDEYEAQQDWPVCEICEQPVHPNAVATTNPVVTCEPCHEAGSRV